MKKLIIILSAALLLISCAKELDGNYPGAPSDRVAPEGYALVNFSVEVPGDRPMTKAFSNTPTITSLHVAVFDENYYLEDYVLATSAGPVSSPVSSTYPDVNYDDENQIATTWNYQVTLPTSNEYRIIHFIANGPDELPFGTEVEVIGGLTTTGGQDAYWQRIELSGGITADGSGNLAAATAAQLRGIKLVRNFSKISVTASNKEESNFELLYAYVLHNASAGTIAPYCPGIRDFIEDYQNYNSDELKDNFSYEAWMPEEYTLNESVPNPADTNPEEWLAPDPNNGNYATTFIYEREKPQADPVIVLIYGKYYPDVEHNPSTYTNYYYKVDLKNTEDEYFAILRNFNYMINIRRVTTAGRSTIQEAIEMPGSGNVSTSIENEELTNISDGISRISVSFTDTTVVSSNTIDLMYRFVPDFQNAPESHDNVVVATASNTTGQRITVSTTPDDGASGMFSFTVDPDMSSPDAEGYSTIHITPVEPGDVTRTQKLTIRGTAIDGTVIRRDITIVLRQKTQLNLYCDPQEIPAETGAEFDVVLQIPGGLSKMIFPLEIKIQADEFSISPNGDNLPVYSGKSIALDGEGNPIDKSVYYFIKTISWAEYSAAGLEEDATKHIRCHFKSNCDASATTIWAENRYFITRNTNLGNFAAKHFANLEFSRNSNFASGRDVYFSFGFESALDYNSLNGGPVTVTLVGLDPDDSETGLTPIGPSESISGGYEYSYYPASATVNDIALESASSTAPWAVYLDAPRFAREECKRAQITISAHAISFTNATNTNPFGSRYNTNDLSGYMLVREEEFPSDMSSAPRTLITRGGQNNARTFDNTDQVQVYATDRIYFLYDKNGTVYSGYLDIPAETTTISGGTVTMAARRTKGTLAVSNMSLNVGEYKTPSVTQNTNGGTVTYVSSDKSIAAVQDNGSIIGMDSGVATVTALVDAGNGYGETSTTFTVTVSRSAVSVRVTDQTVGNLKNNLVITNMGTQKVYIRAALIGAWYDGAGNIVAPWNPAQGTFVDLAESGWVRNGDIYYCSAGVDPGNDAASLFTSYTRPEAPVPGSHLELNVMVQAVPYRAGKTCKETFDEL